MTAPQHNPGHHADVGEGTDVTASSPEADTSDVPATSDPEQYVDDADLGGTGGQSSGGAG